MVTLLWRRETEGKVFDSPERRAALDKALRSAVSRIKDPSLRRHYGQVLNDMRFQLFRAPRRPDWQPGRKGGFRALTGPQAVTRATPLAAGGMPDSEMRVALILATLCLTPALIDDFEHALDRLRPANPDHARLTDFLLGTSERDAAALHAELARRNQGETLENLLSLGHVRIAPCIRHPGDTDKAARCLAEEFAKLAARRGLQDEMTEALEDLGEADESRLRWRLNNALRARQQAEAPRSNDGDAAAEDESSLSKHLSDLIASRAWEKKSR